MVIIGSAYEHDCFDKFLNIKVKNIDELEHQLKEIFRSTKDVYVCWMLTNNITGDNFDVVNIGNICHKYGAYFICDLTASVGHCIIPNNLEEWCDCCCASAHKFYGEKNEGFLWISNKLYKHLHSDIINNLVHGTIDVPGACMLANAMEWVNGAYDESYYKSLVTELNTALFDNNISSSIISKDISTKTYAINAIYLDGINADALQTYLASKDIYIGVAHSACAGIGDYRVLEAMEFNKKIASQTIRVSFGVDSSCDDIKGLVNEIDNFRGLF